MTVLDRAHTEGAVYSAAEIALIEPVAQALAPVVPADDRTIRQSLGSLSAVLPSAPTDELVGALRFNTYMKMLAGCDQDALAAACKRCIDELDWFPTVKQLKRRIAEYVSPEQHAINLARYILLSGEREPLTEADVEPLTDEEIRRLKPEYIRLGIKSGGITQEQVDRAFAASLSEGPAPAEQNEIHEDQATG